ncbi:hypothetical protein HG537_0H04320 [Torulaspora globosa]|uniref:Replication factor C subunit 2 n=1 Tax=Torulaspora globosa TaxID=48254 RepID=A0A7H9HZV7_9SACH|nr:hypothetical protein HG537_0H04320 [Torulaspora sp. CBS 2947]
MLETIGPNKRRKVVDEEDSEHSKPWVEKYRPRRLDEVTAQDHAVNVLKKTLGSTNLPHMLFYGPPGTGKTSTILALTKELFGPHLMKTRILELNASDERGISVVREKVKNFARLTVSKPSVEDREKYPCPPYKIIILDEADSMTADAQSALRRTMETYSAVTRFCLICNYVTRIIDPLASRCSKFRFKSLDTGSALDRLSYIAEKESVGYEDGVLEDILKISRGDMRRAITLLQSAYKRNDLQGTKKITTSEIQEISGLVPDSLITELATKIAGNSVDEIAAYVNDFMKKGWAVTSVADQLHSYYLTSDEFSTDFKNKVSWILFNTDAKLTNGTNEHIQLLNLVIQISEVQKIS